MQVKLTAIYAGPEQTGQPGQIIRVTDSEGEALIAGNYAEPINSVTKTEAVLPEPEADGPDEDEIQKEDELDGPETATMPEPEKAVMPKAKPKTKRKGKK